MSISIQDPNLAKEFRKRSWISVHGAPSSAPSVMFTLSLCDGRRHSRSDDQFTAVVAKMPREELSLSDISKLWRQMPNITHELQPGEMHYNMSSMKDQLTFLPPHHIRRLTDIKLHPEIFSHGVLHAGISVISHAR